MRKTLYRCGFDLRLFRSNCLLPTVHVTLMIHTTSLCDQLFIAMRVGKWEWTEVGTFASSTS